jgi:N-acyl-D-amino-acid deacylase
MSCERLFLSNGTLIEGSGAAPRPGSVLIDDKRIAQLGCLDPPGGARIIDCTGLVIAPGFIDAHSHSDLQVIEGRREKTLQGVTSEVVGNCGFSPYPTGRDPRQLREFANGILCGGHDWGWESAESYLAAAAAAPAANVYSLVGHGSLRVAIAGSSQRPLSPHELDRMKGLLEDSLIAGATGFSTGLMYAPGSCAPSEELEALCRLVARHGKIYATHIRSYSTGLLDAIAEQIDLARRTGCRLQISHLQAVGPAQWPLQEAALEQIELAVHEGLDVAFDCYPYIAGNTNLTQLLPQWVLDGGPDAMVARLRQASTRTRILDQLSDGLAVPWTAVILTSLATQTNQKFAGKDLATIASERGQPPAEALLDLAAEERGEATIITFNQSVENLQRTLTHPLSIIISDALYVRDKPHPRLYGTFPFFLGSVCRDRQWLSLAEGIHKITGLPAKRFGLRQRGLLRPSFYADITVFDPARITSAATYENPKILPEGVILVLRNGTILVDRRSRPDAAPIPA